MKNLRSLVIRVTLIQALAIAYFTSYGGAYVCVAHFPKSLSVVRQIYRPLSLLPLPLRRSLASYGWQVYGWKAGSSLILPKAEPLVLLKDMDLDAPSLISVMTGIAPGSVRLNMP